MPFGLIPWGTGFWGLSAPPIPQQPSNIHVINVTPTPGSYYISRTQVFTFTIKSQYFDNNGNPHTGFPLDINSIQIMLDSKPVIIGTYQNTAQFNIVVTPNIDGVSLDFTINPKYSFNDAEVLTLQVYATDIYGNPSYPFWAGYIVEDTRPPLVTPIYPLDGYTGVPVDLTIHFLVNQLASPNAGLIPSTLNIYVDDVPAVVNGIIQAPFDGLYSAVNLPTFADITSPFEILLDYDGRYPTNEFVIVKVSCDSTIVPVDIRITDGYNSVFTDQYGAPTTFPAFNVTAVSSVSPSIREVTIDAYATGNVFDGYKLKQTNGNIFRIIEVIDGYNFQVEVLPKTLRGDFTFVTAEFDNQLTTPVFAGYFQGVYLVDNLGDGYHVNVTWHPARTTRPDYDLAYLIYYSTTRSDVFYEEPKLITQGRALPPPETIPGADAQLFGYFAQIPLPVGVTYYFGVRATEFPHSATPVVPPDGYGSFAAGRTVVDGYSFAIPAPQILMQDVSGIAGITVPAITAGYSNVGGYIIVGGEIMRYTSITLSPTRGFVVSSTGRGQFGTTIQSTHHAGETIRMYYGNKDDNTVIAKNLVSWESPNDPHRTRPDLVTTDFTLEDGYHAGFEFFDYCGYHRFRPDELLNDSDNCGTYVGGEYNGHRGMSIYDRMLANEEMLLEVTGEPIILLRRLWSGERCICMTSRKDSAKVRSCALCFGTGYKNGYVQYNNPRRDDRRVMVHFAPADEELGMGPQSGWDQRFKPGNWTLAVPAIKDRDVIIRFDEFGERDWIYVVDAVSRAKSMFGRYARQRIKLSRLDKTDVMYQFKFMP